MSRRKTRPQEESDEESESEESESEESDETDELGSDAEEEGMDSSDLEIVVPKEEEEDSSDVEIVEAPKAPNKRASPRKKSPKRVRPASSDEEEDSDNGTPPAPIPAPAPKQLHKKDKQSGGNELNREVRNLHSRFNDVCHPTAFSIKDRKLIFISISCSSEPWDSKLSISEISILWVCRRELKRGRPDDPWHEIISRK